MSYYHEIRHTKDGGKFVLEKNSSPFSTQNGSHDDDQILMTYAGAHSNSLIDAILSRRSIRRYQQKEIPRGALDKILEAGRQAPSAMNRQPWHFIVVSNYEIKKELSKWLFTKHIKDSPVTIVGCAKTGFLDKKWSIIGTSIALQNMVIAAWALGIGSCWIGGFKEDRVKQLLKIPDKWKIVALVTFGYPAETPHMKRKKAIEKVVSFNRF
jgi:nitroreductase